jgi:hypothetical protein
MARAGRTQKQIAERYKGNLGYYRKLHPWRRTRLIVTLITICGGLIAIVWFQKHGRETFFNAGKISANHAGFADNCQACHDRELMTGGPLTPAKFKEVVRDRFHNGVAFDAIDRKCETCHQQHTFHEVNVVQNRSCSACHQEHQGPGPMKMVASLQCATCHNNSTTMQAAAHRGTQLPPTAFRRHLHGPQQVVLELPRPPQGFTKTFSSFWKDHPEFQLKTVGARDPDVLRFNHQRHFAADIPPVNGQKLDCNYCHKAQPDGRFYQRVNFAANCQACHSLQFDARNPELRLPHGDVDLVRTFLRTLPAQYADYARLKKGISGDSEIRNFVGQQVRQLRAEFHSGEELERAVFFTTNPYKPQEKTGAATRANFTGCAFCHDVKQARNAAPAITKPILIDRWMLRSDFNHARHTSVKCDDCHHAMQSRDTADALMPAKANCVTCHSPAGKVAAECTTCHKYHAPPGVQTTVADAHSSSGPISLRQMLIGDRGR